MPPRHFQEATRHDVEDVAVCVRVTYFATLAVGFHVSCQCCWRLEYFKTFQAAIVRSLVKARGQVRLQSIQAVEDFTVDNQLPGNGKRRGLGLIQNLQASGERTVVHVIHRITFQR